MISKKQVQANNLTFDCHISGKESDELWEDYMTWRKSGLQESIKATADYAASSQNFGFGLNAIKSVADKGLVFYREGEMFTRGIAFSIAK